MVAYALLGIGSLFEGFVEGQKARAEVERWRMMNEYYRMMMSNMGWDYNTHNWMPGRGPGYGPDGSVANAIMKESNARWDARYPNGFGSPPKGAGVAGGNQFLNTVMKYESAGGTALISRVDTDSHGLTLAQGGNPDEISQGLFHIQNHPGGTWTQALKNIGLSIKDYPTPRGAPPDIQIKAASTIPYSAWGKQTREEIARDLNIPVNFSGKFGDLVSRFGGAPSAADKPSKAATPEAMMVPSGGQFALPGVTQSAAFSSESDPRAPVDARPIDDSPFNEPSIAAKARGLTPQHPFYRPEDSMRYGDEGAGSVVQDTGAPYGGHSTNLGRPPFHSPPPPPSIPIGGGAGNVLEAPTERGPELAGSEIHQEHPGPDAYRDVLPTGSKGREGKGKETDKPAKKVIPTAAEKKTGIPKGPTIDSQQRPYEMATVPGQHAVGSARSPLNYDPYWRPNPPKVMKPNTPSQGMPAKPTVPSSHIPIGGGPGNVLEKPTGTPAGGPPDQFKTGGPELAAATAPHPASVAGGGGGGGGGPMSAADMRDMQFQMAQMEKDLGSDSGGGGGSNPALSMPDDRLRPPMDVQIPQMVASNEPMAAQPGGGSSYGQVAQAPVNIPTWQRDQDAGDILASRKGGPIQKFNRGGIPRKPVWRAQTGGVAPSSMTGLQYMMQPLSSYVGPLPNGGWSGTPYSQLAPNQQQWANTTQNLMAQETAAGRQDAAYWSGGGRNPAGVADTSQFYNQYTAMPAAIWPTTNTPSVPVSTAPNTTATSTATDPYLTNITAQNAAQQAKTTNDLAAQTASASSAATTANAPTVIKNPNPQATTPTTPASSTPAGTNYTGATGTPTKGAIGSNSASQGDIATTAQKTTSPLAQAYSGFAKGGGIPRRPVLRLQGGGGAAYGNNTAAWQPTVTPTPYTTFQPAAGQPLPTVQPPAMGSAFSPTPGSANATTYAGYQPWGTGLQWLANQPTSQYTNPMMFTGQQISADLQALPAGQQQWYNEQMANKMAQGTGQWYYNPASLPTAPAATTPAATAPAATTPAAPANTTTTSTATDPFLQSIEAQNATQQATLTNDLANQTATGTAAANTANAPTVPKTTTPQATTPTTPPSSTPAATNYSGQPTTKTTGNYGSNYATQGDIATTTQKTTSPLANAYTGFDDGGDVGPSVIGPPPALGSAMGQQTQIPPYYYNPYTYAPSAAPVGKGVSTTSVGTVMPSAAVPTYADGGDVQPDTQTDTTMDSQPQYDPVVMNDMYRSGMPGMGYGMGMGMRDVGTMTGRGGIRFPSMRGNQGFAGLGIPMPPEYGPGGDYEKPEGAPPYASAVSDHQGNPSPDIIHAIQGGVKALMGIFGLQPPGGMPNQQQTQGQQAFAKATPEQFGVTPQHIEGVKNAVDPEHQLSDGMRYLAGLGSIYKYYMYQGREDIADRVAAGMLLYSRELAGRYGQEALKALNQGDEQMAAEYAAMGYTQVPNGHIYDMRKDADGNYTVGSFNMKNQKVWETRVAPEMLVAAAVGERDGVGFWRALQSSASKYLPDEKTLATQEEKQSQDISDQQAIEQSAARMPRSAVMPVGDGGAPTPFRAPGSGQLLPIQANAPQPSAPPPIDTGMPPGPVFPSVNSSLAMQQANAGTPPSPNAQGAAQPNVPPPTTDSQLASGAEGGARPSPEIDTGMPPGPPTVERAQQFSMPAPSVQPVSDEYIAQQAVQIQQKNQQAMWTPQGKLISQGQQWDNPGNLQDWLKGVTDTRQRAILTKQWMDYKGQYDKAYADATAEAKAKTGAEVTDLKDRQKTQATYQHEDWQEHMKDIESTRTTERERVARESTETLKEKFDIFNRKQAAEFAAKTPRTDEQYKIAMGGDNAPPPEEYLARAFVPDYVKTGQSGEGPAREALAGAGFDPAQQKVVKQAFESVMLEQGMHPDVAADAVSLLANGAPGSYDKDTLPSGKVVYHASVQRTDGSIMSVTLDADSGINLHALGNRKVGEAAPVRSKAAQARRVYDEPPAEATGLPPKPAPLGRQPAGPGTIVSPLGPLLHPAPVGRGHGPAGVQPPPLTTPPFTRTMPNRGLPVQ